MRRGTREERELMQAKEMEMETAEEVEEKVECHECGLSVPKKEAKPFGGPDNPKWYVCKACLDQQTGHISRNITLH